MAQTPDVSGSHQETIESIIISDIVNMRHGATQQIPDSKLNPLFYFRTPNALQRSVYRVQCRLLRRDAMRLLSSLV